MPVNKDWLNIKVRDSAIRSGHSLNNLAEILSNPVAFDLQSFERRDKVWAVFVFSKINSVASSCTKKLLVGGINIRNISTKALSNLNEESIPKLLLDYSFFVPGIVFHLSLFYLIFGMSIH